MCGDIVVKCAACQEIVRSVRKWSKWRPWWWISQSARNIKSWESGGAYFGNKTEASLWKPRITQ